MFVLTQWYLEGLISLSLVTHTINIECCISALHSVFTNSHQFNLVYLKLLKYVLKFTFHFRQQSLNQRTIGCGCHRPVISPSNHLIWAE